MFGWYWVCLLTFRRNKRRDLLHIKNECCKIQTQSAIKRCAAVDGPSKLCPLVAVWFPSTAFWALFNYLEPALTTVLMNLICCMSPVAALVHRPTSVGRDRTVPFVSSACAIPQALCNFFSQNSLPIRSQPLSTGEITTISAFSHRCWNLIAS